MRRKWNQAQIVLEVHCKNSATHVEYEVRGGRIGSSEVVVRSDGSAIGHFVLESWVEA